MIFTSFYGNMEKLIFEKNVKNSDLVVISRYFPNHFYNSDEIVDEFGNLKKPKNEFFYKSCEMLKPSLSLLWRYKNNLVSWDKYCEEFYNQLYNLDYRFWNNFEKNFDGKVLLCYEKNFKKCHRYLVGKFFKWWSGKDIIKEI